MQHFNFTNLDSVISMLISSKSVHIIYIYVYMFVGVCVCFIVILFKFIKVKGDYLGYGAVGSNLRTTVADAVLFLICK